MKKILMILAVTSLFAANFAFAVDCDHKNDSGRSTPDSTIQDSSGQEKGADGTTDG